MSSKKRKIQRKQVKNNIQENQVKKDEKNFTKNSTKNKKYKNVKIFAGCAAVVLAGGITLTCCSGCNNDKKTTGNPSVDNNTNTSKTTSSTTISSTTTKSVISDEIEIIEIPETEEVGSNEELEAENAEIIDFEDIEPVYIQMSAEDVVTLSRSFSEYVNKTATLSHEDYKYNQVTPEELYSVVYLANIDSISKEETARLIEAGLISDNIQTNIENSFHFYDLYKTVNIHKIMEGKKDIIDISLLFTNNHDKEVAETMNNIMINSVTASKEVNYKNYMDTVYYYAQGVTLQDSDYNFGQSIYSSDRGELSIGADYALRHTAGCIIEINKMNNIADANSIEIINSGRTDLSNIINVFNGCKISTEIEDSKTLVK